MWWVPLIQIVLPKLMEIIEHAISSHVSTESMSEEAMAEHMAVAEKVTKIKEALA